jgi:hypothetical protein
MPKKRTRRFVKVLRSVSQWLPTLALLVISFFLIIETVSCLVTPYSYPTVNLKDIVNARSIRGDILDDYVIYSSVEFTDAPVNTKQRIQVNIDSLSEVEIEWTCEMYLVENATLHYNDYRFLSYELVSNLEVYFNGVRVEYNCTEYGGKKYYTVAGYNITDAGKISKLEMHFQIERTVLTSNLTRIPSLFNQNYAKLVHLPITNVPVHTGNLSDLSVLDINFDLPFRRILGGNSGWVDSFVPPEYEWEEYYVRPNVYCFPVFEYPIEQESIEERNTYTYKVRFSEHNIADRISLVIVPNCGIPAIFIIFLLSPCFVPLFVWIHEKRFMVKSKIKRNLLVVLEIYSALLALALAVLTFFGGELSWSLFSYVLEITNHPLLVLVLLYPALSILFYELRKARSW